MKLRKFFARPLALLAGIAAMAVYAAAPTTASAYPDFCMRVALGECSAYEIGTDEFFTCYYPAYDACVVRYHLPPPPFIPNPW